METSYFNPKENFNQNAINGIFYTQAALSNPVSFSPKVEQANRFVDQLLSDNRKALEDAISYVKLPDEYFEFSKKIAFIETHGYAKLTKGHLNNLHAISRLDNKEGLSLPQVLINPELFYFFRSIVFFFLYIQLSFTRAHFKGLSKFMF